MKEETKCYCGHTTICDCGELSKIEILAIEERNNKNLKSVISSFIVGYEKAQEKLYSEEEVIELLQKAVTHQDNEEIGDLVTAQGKIRTANFYSWFEQFKKK